MSWGLAWLTISKDYQYIDSLCYYIPFHNIVLSTILKNYLKLYITDNTTYFGL